MKNSHLLVTLIALSPATAFAYIGPGVGLGAIATFTAIVLGLLMLIAGFLWYPLKRMLKSRKSEKSKGSTEISPESRNL